MTSGSPWAAMTSITTKWGNTLHCQKYTPNCPQEQLDGSCAICGAFGPCRYDAVEQKPVVRKTLYIAYQLIHDGGIVTDALPNHGIRINYLSDYSDVAEPYLSIIKEIEARKEEDVRRIRELDD